MKNLKLYLVISICINVLLGYMILKPVPKVSNMEGYLLERISKENAIKRDKITSDSTRFVNEIKAREKKIKTINYLRNNERKLYEIELSKINNLTTDSAYLHVLDSIKAMLRANHNR